MTTRFTSLTSKVTFQFGRCINFSNYIKKSYISGIYFLKKIKLCTYLNDQDLLIDQPNET